MAPSWAPIVTERGRAGSGNDMYVTPCPWRTLWCGLGATLFLLRENKETPWVRPALCGTGLVFAMLRVYTE